jgi:predicted RNA binding protein YcfA (HicA-like mRNA interferase family)
MGERLVPLKDREVLRRLLKAGFEIVRIKGSAHYLRHPQTGRFTSVHLHGGRDIPVALLYKIVVHQAGLTPEAWNAL